MSRSKITSGILLLAMLLVGMVLIPAASAQEEKDYSVTAEEALMRANANMINFIAGNALGFENWTGASINPNPQELYDVNGQKLFYRFSVYKENKLIGTIDVCADKTLGPSIYDIVFDPEPYKVSEAMKKSIEIAKNEYSDGEIKSTQMVVYSYPRIGAMTVVKDKATGVEHRIFVDAYSLDEVEDKLATETEPGIWSLYDKILAYGKENNLKEWQKSDELAKSIEQAAANKGVNINAAVTEENIKKINADAVTPKASGITLPVTKRGQENDVYCGCACCQMIGEYICNVYKTQDYIYEFEGHDPNNLKGGLSIPDAVDYCKSWSGLVQRGTVDDYAFNPLTAVGEINNNRPFMSLSTNPNHFRLCYGYLSSGSLVYLYIIDPLPIGSGSYTMERSGANEVARIYVRPS